MSQQEGLWNRFRRADGPVTTLVLFLFVVGAGGAVIDGLGIYDVNGDGK